MKPFEEDILRDARIMLAVLHGASQETLMTLCNSWPEFRGGLARFDEYVNWIGETERKAYRYCAWICAQQLFRGDSHGYSDE